jgi:hypothetical protein
MICTYLLIHKHNLLLAYINFPAGKGSTSIGNATADYRKERGMH